MMQAEVNITFCPFGMYGNAWIMLPAAHRQTTAVLDPPQHSSSERVHRHPSLIPSPAKSDPRDNPGIIRRLSSFFLLAMI